MMPPSRLGCPLSLKTPNMGNTGKVVSANMTRINPFKGYVDRRQLLLPVLLPHGRMLPNFQRLPIDAHRSDVIQSHLIDLRVFG